jgi:hypothetical protein
MEASQLFTRIRRRLDLEPSEYIDDLENGHLCEEAYFELWDVLIDSLGEEAPWERATFSTVANQDYVDLELDDNIYRILRVDTQFQGDGVWRPIYPATLASAMLGTTARHWSGVPDLQYFARRAPRSTTSDRATSGGYAPWKLYFDPIPTAVHSVRVWYVPAPTFVIDASGDDPVYAEFPDDYPEWVVAQVCAQLAAKQESDPSPFLMERERIEQRIRKHAKPHQTTAPKRLADVRSVESGGDYDGFMGRR